MNLNPIVEIFDGQNPVAFWTFWIFALIGIWVVWFLLTKWRSAKWYMPFWIASISVLSLWWGAALVNAFHVGNGLPGNGWDAYGAAIIFFMSIPAIVLDIIFLLRWPKSSKSGGSGH